MSYNHLLQELKDSLERKQNILERMKAQEAPTAVIENMEDSIAEIEDQIEILKSQKFMLDKAHILNLAKDSQAIHKALSKSTIVCLASIDNNLWIVNEMSQPICQPLDIAPSLGTLFNDNKAKELSMDWVLLHQDFGSSQLGDMLSDPEFDKILEPDTAFVTRKTIDKTLRMRRLYLNELKEQNLPEWLVKSHEEAIKKLEAKRYIYNES